MSRPKTRDAAHGRWRGILAALAPELAEACDRPQRKIDCPVCGGARKFRMAWPLDGGGICNAGCGSVNHGLELLMQIHGWSYAETCARVDDLIGSSPRYVPDAPDVAAIRQRLRDTWEQATCPALVAGYLRGRGLSHAPACLRGHPALAYRAEQADGTPIIGRHPAMLARVTSADGLRAVTIHRTYLAAVPGRKQLMPGTERYSGGAVRLSRHRDVLGIAEGIETALAAGELFGVPVWAAVCAGNLAAWAPPDGVRHVHVFGDRDASYAGQAAAYALARRLIARGLRVDVHLPRAVGDWLDVLNGRV